MSDPRWVLAPRADAGHPARGVTAGRTRRSVASPPVAWRDARVQAITAAVLPAARYRHALVPGCGGGGAVLTVADRCDAVTAFDTDVTAVTSAAAACAHLPHVAVELATDGYWPPAAADLVVLAGVGHDLPLAGFDALLSHCAPSVAPGGTVVAVHRRASVGPYEHTGDDVHARLFVRREWERTGGYSDDDVRIDVFEHCAGRS